MSTATASSLHTTPQTPVQTETSASDWRALYRVGGVAALLAIALIVVAIAVFLVWPPPSTMEGWFALFQRNGFLGLLDLDLLLAVSYVVMIPIYLALYVALRRTSESFMAIALALNLIGTTLILAVNPGAAMLNLSGQYATATSAAQRATFLAAGQSLLANWSGSAFVIGYLLGGVGVLITAAVMFRGATFSKLIAITGLVMGVLMLVPASAGIVGLFVSLLSLVPTVLWFALIAPRFFKLASTAKATT